MLGGVGKKPMATDGLIDALHVDGPAGPNADRLHLYGQFVGSWDITWAGLRPDGRPVTARGELHVGWVLGGRAVQDIWIVPGRGARGEQQSPLAFHGTAIRFYDPAIDAWRCTWIDPLMGRVRRFIGRDVDGDVVMVCGEDEPQLRWSFTDITKDAFNWRGEISRDGGATFLPDEEMRITRQ
jgi:hypothetical protein